MITQKQLAQYRADVLNAENYAAELMESHFKVAFQNNDNPNYKEIREQAVNVAQDAIGVFGDMACQSANDLFEEIARKAGKDVATQIYNDLDPQTGYYLNRKVNKFYDKLDEIGIEGFEDKLEDTVRYVIRRKAFENMAKNCISNNVRYARVPSSTCKCSFCFMLASRGFEYHTKKSAGGDDAHKFHTGCKCVIVPGMDVINQDKVVEGYKPSKMTDRYNDCYKTINTMNARKRLREEWEELKANKETYDSWQDFKTKAFVKEMDLHDKAWLWKGQTPQISYETPTLENEIKKETPQLIDTANRLKEHGIAVDFRADKEGATKSYTNLKNGFDLKPLDNRYNFKIVDEYIQDSEQKSGLKAIVFDNTNTKISDKTLEEYIDKASNATGRIYILSDDGYKFVK